MTDEILKIMGKKIQSYLPTQCGSKPYIVFPAVVNTMDRKNEQVVPHIWRSIPMNCSKTDMGCNTRKKSVGQFGVGQLDCALPTCQYGTKGSYKWPDGVWVHHQPPSTFTAASRSISNEAHNSQGLRLDNHRVQLDSEIVNEQGRLRRLSPLNLGCPTPNLTAL